MAQGARPRVVFTIIVMPLVSVLLVCLILKHTSRQIEEIAPITVRLASKSIHQKRETASAVSAQKIADIDPKTEAALNACGLFMKNPIKLALRAQSRPPIIIPKSNTVQ